MQFDSTFVPYPSIRYPVYARRGMVCASSPQASAAGLEALTRGGNAVDAAVATAAALTVVEPTANGIGSDAFALVWIEREKKLYGLNGSGVAPGRLTLDAVKKDHPGADRMPMHGWTPTMVPGAPKAWAALSGRFGRLPLVKTLSPAIGYAREGYPASATLARMWGLAFERYSRLLKGPVFDGWYQTFAPNGAPPRAGEIVRLLDHAATLEKIAASNAEDFYRGEIADRIVRESDQFGGYFSKDDLKAYDVTWVEPASVAYRGYTVCEIPPNGQGIVALMALNVLKEFAFAHKECVDTYHKQWEAMKIAFADGLKHITDPKHMALDYRDLLSPAYGALRAREIGGPARPPPWRRRKAARCTSARRTAKGTWCPSSRATTWALGPAWSCAARASPCKTGDTTFRSTPRTRTAWRLSKRRITPSFPALSSRMERPWGRLA